MKKIIFYLPSLAPSGGIERIVTEIVNQLSEYYDVTVLVKDDCTSFYHINSNVKIDTINSHLKINMKNRMQRGFSILKNIFCSTLKLKNYFKLYDFDYIYITHPLSHLELLSAKICSDKIIISEHGASNNYNLAYRALKKLTYKKCKFYCIPTTYDMEYYKKQKLPVVYTPHYKPNLDYCRSSLDNKVVLNIGRFTDDKKQLTLLKIWSKIPAKDKVGWELHIVGEGELFGQLEAFISQHKLHSEVKLLPPRSDVETYYKQASLFVLTSRSEGFGMVLLEAISFGLPLITFDCPSGPRDIVNEKNGFLIPVGSDMDFKRCLIKLMNNKMLLKKLSDGAQNSSLCWSDYNITTIWKNVFK